MEGDGIEVGEQEDENALIDNNDVEGNKMDLNQWKCIENAKV